MLDGLGSCYLPVAIRPLRNAQRCWMVWDPVTYLNTKSARVPRERRSLFFHGSEASIETNVFGKTPTKTENSNEGIPGRRS